MADFLDLLKIKPQLAERSVFKYLRYDEGPHDLAKLETKALIACTSRSGSSLLQVCLERYGVNAHEFFNTDGLVKRLFEAGDVKTLSEFANYLAHHETKNGLFAVKGGYTSFLFLYFLGEAPYLRSKWRIVFLRRRNIIRQAISMRIAEKTQQWTSQMAAATQVTMDDYSFEAINGYIEAIQNANQIWERIFGLLDLNPLRLFYEQFTADIDGMTERAARFIGVDPEAFPDAAKHKPWLEVQSTDINAEWERRFRVDVSRMLRKQTLPATALAPPPMARAS